MDNVIYVTGNIIAESGHHVAKDWACGADDSYKEDAIEVIEGDLVMTSDYQTIPYCYYMAKGGVTCTYGNVEWLSNPEYILKNYFFEIDKLKNLAEVIVPDELAEVQLKCIYAGVYAEFESFLIELLSNLILSEKSNYEEYIARKNIDIGSANVFNKVYESVHSITGHNMQALRKEFNDLHIEFPDASVIGRQIEFRHDVIHRSGRKVMNNHLKRLSFTVEGLHKLIDNCNTFVMSLMDEVKRSVYEQC